MLDSVDVDSQTEISLPSSLEFLELSYTNLRVLAFSEPQSLQNLTRLTISGPSILADQFTNIGQLPALRALTVVDAKISTLEFIKRLETLSFLTIARCDIGTDEVVHLRNMKNLKRVCLQGTEMSLIDLKSPSDFVSQSNQLSLQESEQPGKSSRVLELFP